MLRIATAVVFLFAAASATEERCVLAAPDDGGSLPEGLPGCESSTNVHRCVRVSVNLDCVGHEHIDLGGRDFSLVSEAEPVDTEHGALTPVDVYRTADGKDLAYAQIIEEDGHKSLHAIISIGEMGPDRKITLVVTNCGGDCHYMLMPQPATEAEVEERMNAL